MRDVLAERLLAKVMEWSPEDVARERPILQALAAYKYDAYQKFSPGMRFLESLASWLSQFRNLSDRQRAYGCVRYKLIFISSAEMAHFVSMTYPDVVRPVLFSMCTDGGEHCVRLRSLARSTDFKVLLRQSLFLGLSDGAHIDLFRRTSPEVSHEQVWLTYEIPDDKADNMLEALRNDLGHILERTPTADEARFRILFLLDDFSGSGISYFRKEPNASGYAGKVFKILQKLQSEQPWKTLMDPQDLQVCTILYVATSQAIQSIGTNTHDWLAKQGMTCKCEIRAVQEIPETVGLGPERDKDLIELLKTYFDSGIIDEHWRKGKHDKAYLGFDEGALPLVLEHNTPNNSVPLLWFEEEREYRGLFPRVNRHRGWQ